MINFIKSKSILLLNKLTELTGIDFKFIVRGGIWSTVDLIVSNGAALLMVMAFARLLPQSTYGTYSIVLSWAGIFSLFAMSGIDSAMLKSVAQGYEGDLQLAVKYKFKWGLIASVASLGFGAYYLWQGNSVLALSFLIVAVFLPSYLASSVVFKYFFAKQFFGRNTLSSIVLKTVSLISMLAVLFSTDSIPIILLAYFVPDTIVKSCFTYWAIKKHQKNRKMSADTKPYATHLTIMNIIGGISKRIDSILLFHFIGAAEAAIYKFALLPFEKIQNVMMTVIGITQPRFAKRTYEEIYPSISKKLIWFNLGMAIIAALAFFSLPVIYRILFPQYLDSVHYARILLIPFAFASPAIIQSIWFAKAEIKKLYILKVIIHISRIGFFAFFIPLYGMAGAIWSQVGIAIFAGCYLAITFWLGRKKIVKPDYAQKN